MQWIKHFCVALCLAFTLFVQATEPSKININTASADELANLNGIGKVKAEAIIEHRKQIGEFKSLEELTLVKGIGHATLEKNRNLLSLE